MNRPILKWKMGVLQLNCWKNEHNGETWQSFTLERRYFDKKDDSWKSTKSLRTQDLPKVSILVSQAFADLKLRAEEYEEDVVKKEVVTTPDMNREEMANDGMKSMF